MARSRSIVGAGRQPLELGDVGVDDDGQPQLVQVDLLAQDQVQQQVERPLEHGRLDLVGHPPIVNHTGVVPEHRRRASLAVVDEDVGEAGEEARHLASAHVGVGGERPGAGARGDAGGGGSIDVGGVDRAVVVEEGIGSDGKLAPQHVGGGPDEERGHLGPADDGLRRVAPPAGAADDAGGGEAVDVAVVP